MASENNEIGDIVKKCKILLLDIEGTTTSISFVKDKLFPYAEANVKEFLESQWENEDVKEAVAALRKLAIEDQEKNVEGVVTIPEEDAGKEEQIKGLVESVQWQMSADRKAAPLKQLQGLIWQQGYDKGDIQGHVYDDVPPALELWRATEGQKVYIYSSGSVQAQKLLFSRSVAGDLLPHIEGHFDTAVGAKQEPASYVAIAEEIGSKPDEILFLTDIVKEAEAARASGMLAALVSREGNAPLPEEATSSYPVLHSLEQLAVSNKRKPDPQEEEVPAKVPKTDLEADVKTPSEMEASETTATSEVLASSEPVSAPEAAETATKIAEEPEKMEVEEDVSVAEIATVTEQVEKVDEKAEETRARIETIIEEVTNSNGAGDAPVCDIQPVIEESVEKTEKNETEKMETEDEETIKNIDEPKEKAQEKIDELSAPVAEKTPPSAITIQDVTNDQQSISPETEIVDDLVPLVDEPENVEMDELKNVGDVLEKECDEILSKVQDVTNLDNIPVKPLLNSIAEEPIESENGENTNDIVESILDSEMELGDKPCEDIDVNAVQEIKDAKADGDKSDELQANTVEPVEKDEEENKIKETTVEYNKDQEQVEMDKNGSAKTVAEVKRDEFSADKSATSEVTNGKVQESKPEPVEDKMEVTDNVTKPESNVVVENKDSKVPVETVDNNIDSKDRSANPEDNRMESKESSVAPAYNKKESEESAVTPVDNNMESEENNATPVENKMESEKTPAMLLEKRECEKTPATLVENKIESDEITGLPIDMESEEDTTTAVENKTETKEAIAEPIENKAEAEESIAESVEDEAETEKNIAEPVENKTETKESNVLPVNSKLELADSVAKPLQGQKESEDITVESVEKKKQIKENIAEQVDTKMESEDMAESDNKTGSEDIKMEPEDSKMVSDDNKIESEDNTAKPVDNKMESEESSPLGSKTEEIIPEPETAVPKSKANENNTDSKDSSEPIEAVTELKEGPSKNVQMETEAAEERVNGKTNGEPDVTANGDASKEEELNARLSVENGDNGKEVNGANGDGDSTKTEKGQGDKAETETSDIKVKTVAAEEPRPDPIEQPVEA